MFDLIITELRVAFAMFDANGDGYITSTELTEVMKSLGMDTNTTKAQEMITKVDLDGTFIPFHSIDFCSMSPFQTGQCSLIILTFPCTTTRQ